MIEIASAAMPQLGSLLPQVIRPRRWRSPKYPPAASPEQGRSQKNHPVAGREHSLATFHPSKSSLMVTAPTHQQMLATLKSP